MPHHPGLVATAVEAVVRAGATQMTHFGTGIRVDKKGAIDLVTEVDVAIERRFREEIARRFPAHRVLGEEGSDGQVEGATPGAAKPAAAGSSRYRWIFDPIDGTTNYAHGLPLFCASLALEIDGRVEIAAIYEPNRRELFTAERGGGACLNGRPLRVSRTAQLIDALLCTGFPYDVHQTAEEVVGLFGAFVGRARAVRRLGSAALDLCYVAAGRLDGFWEERLHVWDIAAGALIVAEAGGQVTSLTGTSFDPHRGEVLASNGLIHDPMLETIATYRRARTR